MTVVAMMVAMIAILGAVPGIPLGFIPVPIVLQNMGIMIAGELLGPKLGTIAVWLFLFLVVLGFAAAFRWTRRNGDNIRPNWRIYFCLVICPIVDWP